jgi:predicted dehydrogenase
VKILNPYKAVIIGCGRIAGGYDNPGDDVVLTHANAISRSPTINLAGVYDINPVLAKAMAAKWQSTAYVSISALLETIKPDIVIVAVPDEFHEEVLETLLEFTTKIVICEKPLGKRLDKLTTLLEKYRKRNIKLAVNYSRNYDQRIIQLKKEIHQDLYGEFLNGMVFYSKGIRHNGSHAISLLRYLFGNIVNFNVLDSRVDYASGDPSLDIQLRFENGRKCYLLAGDERKYSIFEWQFLFSKSRLIFKRDGFQLCTQEIIDDPLFPGYKTLGEEKCKETALKNSMETLYQNVSDNLTAGQALLCSADDALATQSAIETIFDHLNINKNC